MTVLFVDIIFTIWLSVTNPGLHDTGRCGITGHPVISVISVDQGTIHICQFTYIGSVKLVEKEQI